MVLTLLYDTGARVSELINASMHDIRLNKPATIKLIGKGSKIRIVPLMDRTSAMLARYINEQNCISSNKSETPLFCNRVCERFTRSGIRYIFDKYVSQARNKHPEIIPLHVSPHSFRHSKAVHLLQAGVNIIYIRDLLGHSCLQTTEHYAKIDLLSKRDALEKASPLKNSDTPVWSKDKTLLTWLSSLGNKN